MLSRLVSFWSGNGLPTTILFVVIAAAPFPFGSKANTTIAFWCVLLAVAITTLSLRDLRRQQLRILVAIIAIVICYTFVLHEQLSERPWVAPYHPIWSEISSALATSITPSASIVKNQAFFSLGAGLANIMSLSLGLVIGADRHRAQQIVRLIAYSGMAYAAFGIAYFAIDPTMILWREKLGHLENLTGTFNNRNTAAIYFGSCCVICLLLVADGIRRAGEGGAIIWRRVPHYVQRAPARLILLPFAGFGINLIAMFLTASRAGVVLSLVAMIAAVTMFFRKSFSRKLGWLIPTAVGGLLALVLLQLLGGRVGSRLGTQAFDDEGRVQVWKSTLRLIEDNPWFGTGLGTYLWSFPPYRGAQDTLAGVWSSAHSTPLEFAAELGIPLTCVIGLAWLWMIIILARGAVLRRRDIIVVIAALFTALLVFVHSTIDFTLQIPGYTIPFFALFGAGLAQSFGSEVTENKSVIQIRK
jgi:O-antigen ligase